MKEPERIFAADELNLLKIKKSWSTEELLDQEGIFFLKDVAKALDLDSVKIIKKAREMERRGENPWHVMGLRKIWNHWAVRMTVFSPYYEAHLKSRVTPIEESWDSNMLLRQKGIFLLSEVCERIPFSTYQIRYQAKQNPRAEQEYGIWKDADINRFVVNMEIFSAWIESLWKGNFKTVRAS